MDTAVDDRLLHRLQSLLATYDQLTEGQDEIRLECQRVIFWRVLSSVFVTFFWGFLRAWIGRSRRK